MNSILVAAVAGGLGGLVGAGVVWALAKRLGRQPQWLIAVPIGFAVLAASLARGLAQPDITDQVMAELDQLPTIQAVRQHYPEAYQQLENRMRALPRSAQPEAYQAVVADVVTGLVAQQRSKAQPERSYALYAVTRAEGAALSKLDAAACAAFMDGQGAPAALARVMTPELRTRDLEATSQLLAQAATTPARPAKAMSVEELSRLSWSAVSTLPDRDQDLVIAVLREERQPENSAEHRAMCDFSLALADHILDRPPAEAGQLIRAIWAMN